MFKGKDEVRWEEIYLAALSLTAFRKPLQLRLLLGLGSKYRSGGLVEFPRIYLFEPSPH